MPISFTMFDNEIREFITSNFPNRASTKILDVGVGAAKYRQILYDYLLLDGVEVWEPNVTRYMLKQRYNRMFCDDIINLDPDLIGIYDLVIFGDVLEHLHVSDAQGVLSSCQGTVLVAIPYEYKQGMVLENKYEEHLQDDLTHKLFMERYPGFSVLIQNEHYGVYVRDYTTIEEQKKQPESKKMFVDPSVLKDVHLCIASPVGDGLVTIQYANSLANTTRAFAKWGIELALMNVSGHSIQAARNRIVSNFISDDRYTHLLMIDTDHGWEPENILRLLTMDKDIIGIIARKKVPQVEWAANIPGGDIEIVNGAMRLEEGIGTGFLMFKRKVFEKMFDVYSDLKIKHPDEDATSMQKATYYALFQWIIDKEGVERSEDLTFCKRWTKIGGEIWCDPSAAISHIGTYDYRGSISSIFKGISK